MERRTKSFDDAEREANNILMPILSEHIRTTEATLEVISMALGLAPISRPPTPQKVATVLLNRLANDIRCAFLLALRGYGVEAASLVSTIYELTYTIAYIGSNDKFAQEWVKHDDATKPFRKVLALTKKGLENLHVPDPKKQLDIEYGIYQQFCMPKHANPLFQKYHGIRVKGLDAVVAMGPDTSEAGIKDLWFAMQHGARLAYLALRSFTENHIPTAVQNDLSRRIESIGAKIKKLDDQAVKRWGDDRRKR